MKWLLDQIWNRKLKQDTNAYLQSLVNSVAMESRNTSIQMLEKLADGTADDNILIGNATWGTPIRLPVDQVLKGHSLITGGSGSGKTCYALGILNAVIDGHTSGTQFGFGVLDPKGDLFNGTLFLLDRRLKVLRKSNPVAAEELQRRIVIVDFGAQDPLASYNILFRSPDTDPDFFASNRAEMLLELLTGTDKLSLGAGAVLQRLILLLSEFQLPITYAPDVLAMPELLERLVSKSMDRSVKAYFERQFPEIPKVTIAALQRRIEALLASNSVRLALSGDTAPDFRQLMDQGKIVLVSCFGKSISRDVRRLLQGLVLADIRGAVFARKNPETVFIWLADEAQNLFLNAGLKDNMSDLLTMSRSFGTFFSLLTQNMTAAVHDSWMLQVLYTNLRWSFSMRGDPGDTAFLKSVLPITGRRPRPRSDPFAETTFCSPAEERTLLLDETANLEDRTGYLWLRSQASTAIPMRTMDMVIPSGQQLENATASLRMDAALGGRTSRKVHDELIAERNTLWLSPGQITSTEDHPNEAFTQKYRRIRGKAEAGDD
jgi:hypothetical protein